MATARKLKSGSWRCLVYDYTDESGKRHYKSFTSTDPSAKGKRQAEMLAAEYAMKKEIIQKYDNSLTLTHAIDKYIDKYPILSATTIQSYRTIQKFAFQDIMNKPIDTLDNDILQEQVNKECNRKSNSRKGKGKTITAKTVINEFALVSTVIREFYPVAVINVKLPKKATPINDISQPDVIYNIVKGTDIELPVLLAMWLSFTMSEIKGLTKSRSIMGDRIYIDRVCITVNGQEIFKDIAKNEKRNRILTIPPYIKELIDNVETDILVPQSARMVSYRFQKLLVQNNLPHMSFHDLRHVSASVMAMLNIPDKYAMERGGWKTDKIMKGTYMQTFQTERTLIDQKIDEYFETLLFKKDTEDTEYTKKYSSWLTLFDKEDCESSRKEFETFISMQHEMQHKK